MEKNSTRNTASEGKNSSKHPKLRRYAKKFGKGIGIALLVGATTVGGTWYGVEKVSKSNAKERKDADREKHGSIELKDDTAKTIEAQTQNKVYLTLENGEKDSLNLVDFLDKVLIENGYNIETINPEENKDSISSMELLTTMIVENTLKTGGWIHEKDQEREDAGIERSPNNDESIIGKYAGKVMGNGSYGWFQTQRESIDGYKNDEVRYNNICKKIAAFKLPNKSNKWEELYKQLGYSSIDEMISDLKQKKLDIYKGGDRLGIAFGVVLLNEQKIDRNRGWERFNEEEVDKRSQDVKSKLLEGMKSNDPVRQALNLRGTEGENLKSIYILLKGNGKERRVSFQDIKTILKSPEFKAGEVAAGWCTSAEAWKNGEYLLVFNINELNNRFDNEKNGGQENEKLKIMIPTGNFGPSSLKLAVKYLDLPDDITNKIKDEESYNDVNIQKEVKEYINQHPEILKQAKDAGIDKYIWNFRTFFLLNNDWNGINEKQMKFLEENLNLTFNHLYIGGQTFKNFIKNEGKSNKQNVINNFDILWDGFVKEQNEENLDQIRKILTNRDEFMNFTGLSEKKYNEFIKCDLGPSMLGTSIILSETGNVVPFCQGKPKKLLQKLGINISNDLGGINANASNEVNSVYRFSIGTKNEAEKWAEAQKGTPYQIKEGENSFEAIRSVIFNDKRILSFIQSNSWDENGDPIDSIDQISDEFIQYFTGLDQDGIDSLKAGDKIYFKTRNTGQALGKDCVVGIVGKGDNFYDYIFNYQKNDIRFSKILKNIIGKDSIDKEDITIDVIKQVIRKTNGEIWDDPEDLKAGEAFLIVYPLNRIAKTIVIDKYFGDKGTLDSLKVVANEKIEAYKKAEKLKLEKERKKKEQEAKKKAKEKERKQAKQLKANETKVKARQNSNKKVTNKTKKTNNKKAGKGRKK